jgi:ABC-type multidrug transport system permease subunit
MGINIALNAMIGAVPIFGDIFSIWFRSNVKNVHLLERYLSAGERASTFGNWIFVIAIVGGIILLLIGILFGTVWLIKQLWNVA